MANLDFEFSDDWVQKAFLSYQLTTAKFGMPFVPCPPRVHQSATATSSNQLLYLPSFGHGYIVDPDVFPNREELAQAFFRRLFGFGALGYVLLLPTVYVVWGGLATYSLGWSYPFILCALLALFQYTPWARKVRSLAYSGVRIELPAEIAYELEQKLRMAGRDAARKRFKKELPWKLLSGAVGLATLGIGNEIVKTIVGKSADLVIDKAEKIIDERERQHD